MKILTAVMGAIPHALNGLHQTGRETWVQNAREFGDYRFFIGQGDYELKDDEVRVEVPDTTNYILYKTIELLKWSLARGYDRILKIDTDTYIASEAYKQDYTGLDYIGSPVGDLGSIYSGTNCYGFVQGSATWLSAKAAQIIINDAVETMSRLLPDSKKFDGKISPYPHSEDLWVGQALTQGIRTGNIRALSDLRYSDGPLTYHFARTNKNATQGWMRRLHDVRDDPEKMQQIHASRGE